MSLARARKAGDSGVRSMLNSHASYRFGRHALGNIAIQQRRRKPRPAPSSPIPAPVRPKQNCPMPKQRRIHHGASQQPRQQIAAEVARFGAIPARARRCAAIPPRAAALSGRSAAELRPARPGSAESPATHTAVVTAGRRQRRLRENHGRAAAETIASGAAAASSPAPWPSRKFRSTH